LHLTLTKDKEQNKEVMWFAEICRSKREMQVLTAAWDIQGPVSGKMKLITYMENYAKDCKAVEGPKIYLSVLLFFGLNRQDLALLLCLKTLLIVRRSMLRFQPPTPNTQTV
jgi:hypothetical protein